MEGVVRSNDLGSTGWCPSDVEILRSVTPSGAQKTRFAQDDYPCRIVSFEWVGDSTFEWRARTVCTSGVITKEIERSHPCKTRKDGPPEVLLLPGELQKWYLLIACRRRQEEGRKGTPPATLRIGLPD